MPRIANVNLLGVLLAAVVIYFIGFLWYGLFFGEPYMNGIGVYFNEARDAASWLTSEGVLTDTGMGMSPVWMAAGFLIPLALSFGLGWHMKRNNIRSMVPAMLFGLSLSLLIGLPLMAYALVYAPWHSWAGFLINGSHTVVTFIVGCLVLSFFD